MPVLLGPLARAIGVLEHAYAIVLEDRLVLVAIGLQGILGGRVGRGQEQGGKGRKPNRAFERNCIG